MILIEIMLALAALYCAGAYVWAVYAYARGQTDYSWVAIENHTFHLGVCLILAVGFLGLLLK